MGRLAMSGKRQRVAEVLNINGQTYRRLVAHDYDALNRLTSERTRSSTGSAWPADWPPTTVPTTPATGDILYDVTPGYTSAGYDPVGNRFTRASSGINIITAGGSAVLQDQAGLAYDANDRLNYVASPASYDANGNALYQGGGYVSQTTPQQIVPNAANPDQYDFENRLIRRSDGSTVVGMTYDGDGNRVSKTVGSTTTKYLVADRNPTGYAQVLVKGSKHNFSP